jgi:hypothetical protein
MMEKLGFSVQSIIGPILFHETVNSKHYVKLILSSVFSQLACEEKLYGHFMQDNAKTQTTNSSLNTLDKIFGE